MQDHIFIKGARENNLKNIDVTIPRDKLVVLTGLSGSGKSSLAFDTIYAEGQRRYVESLSSYARMFLGQMDKPDVDYIDGLSPAISIDQKTTSKNPRSTVGTVTEIYDYLRLLWARVGTPHCPKCGKEIRQQTIDQIIDQIMALPEGTRIQVLAPVVRGRKGEHAKVLDDARRSGYVRVRADGNLYDLSEDIPLEKNKKHNIEIVVDRLIVRPDGAQRLTDSVETASHLSGGIVLVNLVREGQDLTFSQNYACDDCGISIEELTPRMFSFNNPFGACPTCTGLGMQLKADPALIIPDDRLSIQTSQFVLFDKKGLVHISNMDYEMVYSDISQTPLSPEYCTKVNFLVLDMIGAYDEQTRHDEKLLNLAEKICDWLKSIESMIDPEVLLLNKLQITKRRRTLSMSEIIELAKLTENSYPPATRCGAYLLMDADEEAQKCFDELPLIAQEEFLKYPICHFGKPTMKEDKTNG